MKLEEESDGRRQEAEAGILREPSSGACFCAFFSAPLLFRSRHCGKLNRGSVLLLL